MGVETLILKAAGTVAIRKGTESLLKNRKQIEVFLKSKCTSIRNEDVRFSISYLIRIKIPGTSKFLLVRGNRIKEQFQPVGGVYQKYGGFSDFYDWGYKEDTKIGVDHISKKDLRFFVKGKHTVGVIKWFEKCKDREVGFEREFREELLNTRILDKEVFENVEFSKIRKVMKLFSYSDFHQCREVMIYDIVELNPNSLEQEKALRELLNAPRERGVDYILADLSEIEQLRILEDGQQIGKMGEHTHYLINKK